MTVPRQIAQKLYGCTTTLTEPKANDRAHDLVDLQLLAVLLADADLHQPRVESRTETSRRDQSRMRRVTTDELAPVRRTLWAASDELRANSTLSPAEYRSPVPGRSDELDASVDVMSRFFDHLRQVGICGFAA